MVQTLPHFYLLTNTTLLPQPQRAAAGDVSCGICSTPLAAVEQCQADRFTALNATPSDLERVEQVVNQAIFMFLDKHFKENKDKGPLYGAICSIQPLIQLNIFVASQRAHCDLPGLHRRMLYPFKVTPGCVPVSHPRRTMGRNYSWATILPWACSAQDAAPTQT